MATPAAILQVAIEAQTSGAMAELRRFNSALVRTDKTTATATTRTTQLGKATSTAGSKLRSAAGYAASAAAAYLSISQAKAAVETTQNLAQASDSLSTNLGLNVKQASRWASVAGTRDISTKALNASFTTLTTKLTDARAGSEEAMDSFKALGISQRDLQRDGNNFNQTLSTVAEALHDTEGGAKRQAAATALLGRGYGTLLPIMGKGSDALREQLRLGDQYGATMGKDAVNAQGKLTAKLRESQRAWQGLQITFTQMITPALMTANDEFQNLSRIMADKRLTNAEKFEQVAQIIEKWAGRALDAFIAILPKIAEKAAEGAPRIAAALVEGFMNAPVWGTLLGGAWLLNKFGGLGGFGGLGTKLGTRFGMSFGGAAGPIAVGLIGSALAGAKFAPKVADALQADIGINERLRMTAEHWDITIHKAKRLTEFMERHPGVGVPEALEAIRPAINSSVQRWEHFWGEMRRATDEGGHKVKTTAKTWLDAFGKETGRIFRGTADEAKRGSDKVLDSWTFGLSRTADQAQSKGGKFRNNLAQSFWGGANASADAMGHMAGETNKTLKSLGGAKGKDVYVAKFGKMAETSGGGAGAARQKGGIMVPGVGSGDKVKALLEPGEVVINREAVRAMGGAQKANQINKVVPRFAAGGEVGGLNAGIRGLVNSLSRYGATVTSGLRAGDSGSLHSTGNAADVSFANWAGASRAVNAVGPKLLEGIYNPGMFGGQAVSWDSGQKVPTSFWGGEWGNHLDHIHLAVAEGAKAVAGAIAKQIEQATIKGPKGAVRDMAQGAADAVHTAANALIERSAPALSEGAMGLGVSLDGPVQASFAKVAKRLSTSKVATLALGEAGFAESGMQDLSYGDSSSQGALQLLASTAAGMGINPHDEGAIASAFLLRGYYGRGGANKLAAQGLPAHLVAQSVQGSAFSSGSNYAAQEGPARAWMKRYGLKRGGIVGMQKGGIAADFGVAQPLVEAAFGAGTPVGGGAPPGAPGIGVAAPSVKDLKKLVAKLGKSDKAGDRRTLARDFSDQIKAAGITVNAEREIAGLQSAITTYGQNADMASQITSATGDGTVPQKVRGFTETAWVWNQLRALFDLRTKLIDAQAMVEKRREQLQDLLAAAQKHLDDVKKAIKKGEGQAKDFRKRIKDAKTDHDTNSGKWRERLKDELAKPEKKRDKRLIADLREKLAAPLKIEGLQRQLEKVNTQQTKREYVQKGLEKIIPGIGERRETLATQKDDLLGQLDTVQGTSTLRPGGIKDFAFGELAGDIFTQQMRLRELSATATPDQPEPRSITDLLEFVQAARLGVFGPKIPAFAAGGIAPGGMALVGEKGPELASLPAGTRVHSNADSQSMMGGDQYFDIYIGGEKIAEHVRAQLRSSESADLSRWRAGVISR